MCLCAWCIDLYRDKMIRTRERENQTRRYSEKNCVYVCVCSVSFNIIFSFCQWVLPSCPLVLLAVALFSSIPFAVMGAHFSSFSVTVSSPCTEKQVLKTWLVRQNCVPMTWHLHETRRNNSSQDFGICSQDVRFLPNIIAHSIGRFRFLELSRLVLVSAW